MKRDTSLRRKLHCNMASEAQNLYTDLVAERVGGGILKGISTKVNRSVYPIANILLTFIS